jgi:hypothetical protein
VRRLASHAGVAMIVASALWLRHAAPEGLGWRSLGAVLGASLVLWSDEPDNLFLKNVVAQRIGRWSYSTYLWHWPLVCLVSMDDVASRHPFLVPVVMIATSLLLGWMSFTFIESRRVRASKRGWYGMAEPAGMLASAAVLAGVTIASGGFAFRSAHGGEFMSAPPARESDYFPAKCSNFEKPSSALHPCPIERGGEPKVLVIGDSLAEHLYGYFRARSQVTVTFFTESECVPVPNFRRMQVPFDCEGYMAEALRWARKPSYDTILFSGDWTKFGLVGPPYCHLEASGACTPLDLPAQREVARAELRGAFEALMAMGKTVLVLDGTPAATINIPRRLLRERFWFGKARFELDRAVVEADNAWIDPFFAELDKQPRFHRLSLRDTLCDARKCKVYDPELRRSIYSDGMHFDPLWIAQRGVIFDPFVRARSARSVAHPGD